MITEKGTRRVWLASDGDMWDEIARAVYGSRTGALEALLEVNPDLARTRAERLLSGDEVALPALPPEPVSRRLRLFS